MTCGVDPVFDNYFCDWWKRWTEIHEHIITVTRMKFWYLNEIWTLNVLMTHDTFKMIKHDFNHFEISNFKFIDKQKTTSTATFSNLHNDTDYDMAISSFKLKLGTCGKF